MHTHPEYHHKPSTITQNENYNISIQFTREEIIMMMVPLNPPAQLPKAPSV